MPSHHAIAHLRVLTLSLLALSCSNATTPRPVFVRAVTRAAPAPVVATIATTAPATTRFDLSSGCARSCSLRNDRSVWCWAPPSGARHADPAASSPQAVEGIREVRQLACGAEHCCALRGESDVSCWTIPERPGHEAPVPIAIEGLSAVAHLASGGPSSCAALRSGAVACWRHRGRNNTYTAPELVPDVMRARQVAVGGAHACALLEDGAVRCWGSNAQGQLGEPSRRTSNATSDVVGALPAIAELAAGARHTCARSVAGEVWCWGDNERGQLGIGPFAGSALPVRVPDLTSAESIAAGATHTCVVMGGGAVECWGDNRSHALGVIRNNLAVVPVPVPDVSRATRVALACDATCVLRESGEVLCWGGRYRATDGAAGAPVPVSLP